MYQEWLKDNLHDIQYGKVKKIINTGLSPPNMTTYPYWKILRLSLAMGVQNRSVVPTLVKQCSQEYGLVHRMYRVWGERYKTWDVIIKGHNQNMKCMTKLKHSKIIQEDS